jgi:hypothetical protein
MIKNWINSLVKKVKAIYFYYKHRNIEMETHIYEED